MFFKLPLHLLHLFSSTFPPYSSPSFPLISPVSISPTPPAPPPCSLLSSHKSFLSCVSSPSLRSPFPPPPVPPPPPCAPPAPPLFHQLLYKSSVCVCVALSHTVCISGREGTPRQGNEGLPPSSVLTGSITEVETLLHSQFHFAIRGNHCTTNDLISSLHGLFSGIF